jgi:hypothetical protein
MWRAVRAERGGFDNGPGSGLTGSIVAGRADHLRSGCVLHAPLMARVCEDREAAATK